MVKGLTVALRRSQFEQRPEILIQDMPRKSGDPSILLDGVALAYYVLSPSKLSTETAQQGHRADFINGGDYRLYSLRAIELFTVLKQFNLDITIALPLADGTLPASSFATEKWTHKQKAKFQHIQQALSLVDKPGFHSYPDILPNMILSEIADAAASQKIKVVTTRHNLTKFCASYVASGLADAVVSQNSDFMIFKGVNYIPLDSIYLNEEKVLQVSYFTNSLVVNLLGLQNPDSLFDLSFVIGNPHTELLVPQSQLLEIFRLKPSTKPEAFVATVVAWLNSPEYTGLTSTSPMAEYFIQNPNLNAILQESQLFFSSQPLDEGDSEVRKLSNYPTDPAQSSSVLPNWAVAIEEGGDFWADPMVDDYSHDVKTEKVTAELRRVCYGILGREKVTEHTSDGTTVEVEVDAGVPKLNDVRKLSQKKDKIMKVWNSIIHDTFPANSKPDLSKDPLPSIEEPIQTAGYALRVIVAQCFTDNQTPYSKMTSQNVRDKMNSAQAKILKKIGVIGAPPLDLFEIKSIAGMLLILCSNIKFQIPSCRPMRRRIKVAALYQSTLQHLIWLQQLFGIFSERSKPHRFYDGELFGALYEASGDILNSTFLSYFGNNNESVQKVKDLLPRLNAFIEAILYPFPQCLFPAFSIAPRNVPTAVYDQAKPPPSNVSAAKSTFSALMASSDEDEEEEEEKAEEAIEEKTEKAEEKTEKVEKVEVKVEKVALPPPPSGKGKKGKKGKQDDEEDEEAFLLALAAQNAEKAAKEPKQETKSAKKQQKKFVRKGANASQGKQVFTSESKNELKRQLKQQAMGVYE